MSSSCSGPGAEAVARPVWPVDSADERLLTLAHELRGRVQALVLSTETMLSGTQSNAASASRGWLRKRLEHHARSLESMRQLIESLLETQLTETVRERSMELIDLRNVVTEVLTTSTEALRAARCCCSYFAPSPVPGRWDAIQLQVAVGNLVGNAIKYGAGRPVEVSVGVVNDTACVCVTDHGTGVQPEDRERIFELFRRAASSEGTQGFGVGLWLVRKIARAHGGDVTVRGELGKGASFTITLPLWPTTQRPYAG